MTYIYSVRPKSIQKRLGLTECIAQHILFMAAKNLLKHIPNSLVHINLTILLSEFIFPLRILFYLYIATIITSLLAGQLAFDIRQEILMLFPSAPKPFLSLKESSVK